MFTPAILFPGHAVATAALALTLATLPPVFHDNPARTTTNGTLTLRWEPPADWAQEPVEYELRGKSSAADAPPLHVVHMDRQTFVSGLPDGTYEFTIRARLVPTPGASTPAEWTDWSAPQVWHVKHHSLTLALVLCGVGAVVFLATALFVITQSRAAEAPDV